MQTNIYSCTVRETADQEELDRFWWIEAYVDGHTGGNDPKPFIKYMLGIILGCYREFEERLTRAEKSGPRSTSYDVVWEYAMNHIGTFTKQNALAGCPSLGSSSVEAALKKLVQDGTTTRLGSGRKTHYVRSDALD